MMLSNNDKTVKFLDLQTFEIPKTFNFDFAVNVSFFSFFFSK